MLASGGPGRRSAQRSRPARVLCEPLPPVSLCVFGLVALSPSAGLLARGLLLGRKWGGRLVRKRTADGTSTGLGLLLATLLPIRLGISGLLAMLHLAGFQPVRIGSRVRTYRRLAVFLRPTVALAHVGHRKLPVRRSILRPGPPSEK